MITFDRWNLVVLPFEVGRISELWVKLADCPTLFSDSTRGDIQNLITAIRDSSYVWYQVMEKGEMIGIIYCQVIDDKADIHIAFFDRKPAEKKELVKFFCKFMFDALPHLHKITAAIPDLYYATWRLAKAVGFTWEGTLREDVMLNGKRYGVHLYGLLRQEVYGLPQESRESRGDGIRDSSGRSGSREGPGLSTGRTISPEGSKVGIR